MFPVNVKRQGRTLVSEFSFQLFVSYFLSYVKRLLKQQEALEVLKHSFPLIAKDITRKLAASAFKCYDWMKVLAASLRVGLCDEWKKTFKPVFHLANLFARTEKEAT